MELSCATDTDCSLGANTGAAPANPLLMKLRNLGGKLAEAGGGCDVCRDAERLGDETKALPDPSKEDSVSLASMVTLIQPDGVTLVETWVLERRLPSVILRAAI